MDLTSGNYVTRSGLTAKVVRCGSLLVGNIVESTSSIFAAHTGPYIYKSPTTWDLSGKHAFCRCDDIVYTFAEFERRAGKRGY